METEQVLRDKERAPAAGWEPAAAGRAGQMFRLQARAAVRAADRVAVVPAADARAAAAAAEWAAAAADREWADKQY